MFTSCRDDYDDTALWDTVNNHEQRLAALEEWQNEVNHNIQSLYTLINTTDYITSVTPLVEGGVEVGYTITFLHSDPITIYHGQKGDKGEQGDKGDQGEQGIAGQDGADGHTPQIGLTQEADGNWYWTLDGALMLDPQGNPIRANGEDGQDGQDGADGEDGQDGTDGKPGQDGQDGAPAPVPQISLGSSITEGIIATDNGTTLSEAWYLSVDNGETWYRISGDKGETGATGPVGPTGPQGPAGADGDDGQKGEDGDDGQDGDTMFAKDPIKLSDDGTHYIFTLADGQTFKLPVYRALQIGTDGSGSTIVMEGTTTDIPITLPAGSSVDDFSALVAQIIPEDNNTGIATRADASDWKVTPTLADDGAKVTVIAPTDGSKALLRVTLIDNNGSELTASRVLQAYLRVAAVGDFYYSDGTYSATLDATKTCIGVVFYVGDVAKDDTYLQAKIGDTSTGIHGLVVALKNADGTADKPTLWGGDTEKLIGQQEGYMNVSYKDIPQTLIGYGCTEALRHYNETAAEDKKCQAVSAVDAYTTQHAAPTGTSGWYLPGLKELALLISGDGTLMNQVNIGTANAAARDIQLEAAKGDKLIGAWYWTSLEKDGTSGSSKQIASWTWGYHCGTAQDGRPISILKYLKQEGVSDYSDKPLRTRAILAF